MAITPLQCVHPIHAKPRGFVAACRMPDRDIWLSLQMIHHPIIAVIVDDQKMIDPKVPVIPQKIRHADRFVVKRANQKRVAGFDLRRVVLNRGQLARFASRAEQIALSPEPQLIGAPKPHLTHSLYPKPLLRDRDRWLG